MVKVETKEGLEFKLKQEPVDKNTFMVANLQQNT